MKTTLILSFILLFGNVLLAQYDHLLPESSYPYWPEYGYLKIEDLDTIEAQQWIDSNHISNGWDWSMPAYVEPSPRSLVGLQRNIGENIEFKPLNLKFESNSIGILWVKWRDIEKTPGNFDFTPIINRINQANSVGSDIILRILGHSKSREGDINKGEAPLWLEELGVNLLPQKDPSHNLNFDPSHPEFHKHYLRLVDSLAATEIPNMVMAAYVGYASHSFGDEGIGPYGENSPEANDTVQHVRERLNAWHEAFLGIEHKIFMGGPVDYGFQKGFGVRRGFVEMYWYHVPDNLLGQKVNSDGYLYVDESAPIINYQCFNGEVNEEYEPAWATPERNYRFGETTNSFPYRYFVSNLRALQMRCTYIHTTGHLIPKMLPFISQELGRTVEDTPDAWSFLITSNLKSGEIKHFERWLYQRDEPGYETQPDVKMQHVRKMWMIEPDMYYDYITRKGEKMGFNVDDRLFPDGEQPMAIKVSFIDSVGGTIKLKYATNQGVKVDSIETTGQNKIRTATFFISARMDDTGFDYDYDFIIESEEEVPISFVRVVKTQAKYINKNQLPYGGESRSIPGTIECEHYDIGEPGLAYQDDHLKEGDENFRTADSVDVVFMEGAGNDSIVSFTNEGEWLEYTVDVPEGRHDATLYYYCGEEPGELEISLNEVVLDTIRGINNNGWNVRDSIKLNMMPLKEGNGKILRLKFVNGAGFNIDAIKFEKSFIAIQGISLAGCSSQAFTLGDSLQLSADIIPYDAHDKTVTWTSSDTSIASVDRNGLVITITGGTVNIIASSFDGSFKDSCVIDVFDPNFGQMPYGEGKRTIPGYIEAEEYDLGGENIAYFDDNIKEGFDFRPEDNVDFRRTTAGDTLITKTEDGEWVEYTIDVAEGYYNVSMFYISAWPQDCEVILTLDDVEIVKFSALSVGPDWETMMEKTVNLVYLTGGQDRILRLTISETNANVQIDALEFTSVVNVDSIVVTNCPTEPLIIESTHQLNFEISPANADDKSGSWSSSNDDIATVNPSGLVTAISEGTATIIATTNDGNLTDQCVVNIEKATIDVTDLTMDNCPNQALDQGSTHQLSAIISPVDATDQSVSWFSDDTTVAKVSESGLITAVSSGNVTITVRTTDGLFVDQCEITVNSSAVNFFSINENNNQITIYPNPVSNKLFIEFSNIDKEREIRILNALGQLIYQEDARESNQTISTEKFDSMGFMSVQIISKNNVSVFKILTIAK